ncbi:Chromatin modification-related protein [Paramyrothecium foliicola]|nr:Chromatin modification-related protein [Paramyrothecium foliicola]
MKSAKAPAADTAAQSSQRRSQPVRQTRTNPPRSSANVARLNNGRESLSAGPASDQPIDIFPAITHFADAMTALPKELVRHFTLLKEVDAKIYAPEEQLFKLVSTAANLPIPDSRANLDIRNSTAPTSAPMSAQNSSSGIVPHPAVPSLLSADESNNAPSSLFDPSNFHRRQHFRQTAFKIQEMLVALEEKNHVISTANDALQRQLARVEDVWPYVEGEFSDEAKWGSTTHWAYPENRTGKSAQAERARRDGAAAISAAAQALADEAAARSDARKQAVQAKKNMKNQSQESTVDDQDGRLKGEPGKKSAQSKVRKTAEGSGVGLGITAATGPNGNPPPKRRKVEKVTNGAAPMERAMSSVFGNSAPKTKASSPRATPVPEGPKKRKALPSGSGQSKKKTGGTAMSPSAASSPVLTVLPEPKITGRASPPPPPPASIPRPASSRARQNSIQSNSENGRARPASAAPAKANGNGPGTPDVSTPTIPPRLNTEAKPTKESSAPARAESVKNESDKPESALAVTPITSKKEKEKEKEKDKDKEKEKEQEKEKEVEKEPKTEERDRKSESIPPTPQVATTVTTKSGRASKPSTPALSTFQEAARPRSSRNSESIGGSKKSHRKSSSVAQIVIPPPPVEGPTSGNLHGDGEDDDGDIDADEPTYCYCNSVSYGEMVACDAEGCPREWFHLACVGLRVAPGSKTKWYCEDCKERLKMGAKKVNGR